MKGSSGGKPTPAEQLVIDKRRQDVADLYRRGVPQHEIAERFGVCQQAISRDLAKIRAAWLKSAIRDFDAAKAEELAKIDHIEAVAWKAWDRSTQDAETRHAEKTEGRVNKDGAALPDLTKKSRTRKGQAGDPRFLERIAWCVETRLKIIGALKADGSTVTASVTIISGVDLKAIIGEVPGIDGPRFNAV
jgi:hypothetical protein